MRRSYRKTPRARVTDAGHGIREDGVVGEGSVRVQLVHKVFAESAA